jgi:hypothetical protein
MDFICFQKYGGINTPTTPTETKFTCVSLISIRVFLASPIFFMSISPGVEVPSGVIFGYFYASDLNRNLTRVEIL